MKAMKKKNDNGQEKKIEITIATKKATMVESMFSFLFSYFLVFFYRLPPLVAALAFLVCTY